MITKKPIHFSTPHSCTQRVRKWQWCSISIAWSTFDSLVYFIYNTRALRKCYTLHCFRYITKIHRKCDVYPWYRNSLTHPFSHPFSHRVGKKYLPMVNTRIHTVVLMGILYIHVFMMPRLENGFIDIHRMVFIVMKLLESLTERNFFFLQFTNRVSTWNDIIIKNAHFYEQKFKIFFV